MIRFILSHPVVSAFAAVYLIVAALGWLFIAGAAIASRDEEDNLL